VIDIVGGSRDGVVATEAETPESSEPGQERVPALV
jgi:hypothetical protein